MQTDHEQDGPRFGAVVIFKDGITREQAELILSKLATKDLIGYTRAHAFDPSWGGPVWYIP